MKKYFNNERGLSLIEVVAAIVLLSIVLFSFFYFFIQNAKLNSNNNEHHTATAVARELSAEITSNCSLVKSATIPSICTYSSGSTRQGTSPNGYPYRIIHDNISFKETQYYRLRKVTIKVWEKYDDIASDPPKSVTYAFQREVK